MSAGSEEEEREAFTAPNNHVTYLADKFKGCIERPESKPTFRDVYPQVVAACIAHTLVIQAGINLAFSAILLPQLMEADSALKVDTNEASWIASLVAIVTPVGALICGPLMDVLGRKRFSLFTTVPLTLSWVLMVASHDSVEFIYVARILAGFGGGLTTVSLVYISEVSDASWRPMLLCLNSVFVSLGILLTNVLGVCLPWRVVAGLFGVLSVLSAVAIALYIPESPHWLLTFHPDSDKHLDWAEQSLHILYPNQQMLDKEWSRLMVLRSQRLEGSRRNGGFLAQLRNTARNLPKRTSLLPITLLVTIFIFQQLSGTYPIIFYAVQVFQSIEGGIGAGLDAYSATVTLGIIRFAMSLLTAILSHSCGRRPLMIVSGLGMTVSALFAAFYFQLSCVFTSVFNKDQILISSNSTANNLSSSLHSTSNESSGLIGLLCILLFVSFGSIGMLIIPWTLVGEILPTTVRGVAGGALYAFTYVLMFYCVKLFPFLMDKFQISGLFYFFSCTAFSCVIVVYLFLPETMGKSFDEIEKSFMSDSQKQMARS